MRAIHQTVESHSDKGVFWGLFLVDILTTMWIFNALFYLTFHAYTPLSDTQYKCQCSFHAGVLLNIHLFILVDILKTL